MTANRRDLLRGAAAGTAAGILGLPALAQAKARVVVIGGGAGGATVARYLAKDAGNAIDVVMVEPGETYTTCFHSNLWLGGFKTLEQNTFSYANLLKGGVRQAKTTATAIDRDRREVRLADGTTLPYDRLVLSPGIDIKFDSVPGYSEAAAEKMPHAWRPGPQMMLLKRQLDSLEDGALIVMVAPPNPYRCPPGPYERVSMMAHVLKTKGHKNSRIVVLDPKDTFSKQPLFQDAWERYYPGMVEWQDPKMHGGIKGVDASTLEVKTDLETHKANLVNVIPAQAAGKIARDPGLANASGYCAIDPANMRSSIDPNIYVVGDSCIPGDMPKSAFSANSQAKVAAMMIRGELAKARTFPARYTNTCWSLLAPDDTVKVGGRYEAKDGKIAAVDTFVSQKGESADQRKQTSEENTGWYAGITTDIFG